MMSGVRVLDKQRFIFSDGGAAVDAATDVQWETDQGDYLYCTALDKVDRWHPEVSLVMQHALAKVSFRVLEAEGGTAFSGSHIEQVALKSPGGFKKSTSAKLNIATGGLSGTLTAVDQLTFISDGDLRAVGASDNVAEVAVQAFGLVIPVTGVAVTLELTLDDGRVFHMSPSEGGGARHIHGQLGKGKELYLQYPYVPARHRDRRYGSSRLERRRFDRRPGGIMWQISTLLLSKQ